METKDFIEEEKIEQENLENEEVKGKKKLISQEDIMELLNNLYEKSKDGIPYVSKSVEDLANEYLTKHDDTESAAKSFVNFQIAKCTTSGFLTGFGGFITLPITIPANISSVLYVQMRMIATLAHMGGYDVESDQVQTLVYACLAGISVDAITKQVAIKFGTKFGTAMVKKIPGKVLTSINQKVGFRFLTKFGTTGLINIGKAIPVVGAVIGGGFDLVETKIIADRAYKMFILGDFTSKSKNNDEIIDVEDIVEITNEDLE